MIEKHLKKKEQLRNKAKINELKLKRENARAKKICQEGELEFIDIIIRSFKGRKELLESLQKYLNRKIQELNLEINELEGKE